MVFSIFFAFSGFMENEYDFPLLKTSCGISLED